MVLGRKVLYAQQVGGQAISVQDENTNRSPSARLEKRWFKRWWAWLIWALLSLILILFILGLWAWAQRYELMENRVIDILAKSGFETELDIVSVTRTQARIKDIKLRIDGGDILLIEDLKADYVWPDIRDGNLKRLQVNGATGQLTLGEDWRPSDDWLQRLLTKGSGSGAKNNFPENGIKVTNGTLKLTSPLGTATAYIDAEIPTQQTFKSEITLAPSDLSYAGYAAKGAGFTTVEKTGDDIRFIGQAQTATLSNGKLDVTDAHLQFDGGFNLKDMAYTGSLSLASDSLSSVLFASGPTRLSWDGKLAPRGAFNAEGTWSITAKNARSPRPARAAEIAETLSLFTTLRKVPVTEHYAPQLRSTVENFILGANIAGQGRLIYGPEGFTVNPVGAFNVKTNENQLSLRARPDQDFYRFNKPAGLIATRMDAVFDKPVGLTLTDIHIQAASDNGIKLNGIEHFATQLVSQSDWLAIDKTGQPARLGPVKARLRYNATDMPRRLSVNTKLDYDGELPGGYVEGLALDGRLDVRLYNARQELDFTPKGGSRIALRTLNTPTNWQGENMSFTLPATTKLFTRTATSSILAAQLGMADFTLTHPETDKAKAQRLDIKSANMKLKGTLNPDRTQDWTVDFKTVDFSSETLPGPDTRASAAQARLTAKLAQGLPPNFTLDSPSITAETPRVRLSDIQIALSGTPDSYAVEHSGGTIDVIGSEFAETAKTAGLASFPANGTVNFENGVFTGKAALKVAKANDAEVDVVYSYQNGVGTAEIDIPSILFTPKGLQPQSLVPAFRGKVARVEGEARAKLSVAFENEQFTDTSGTLQLVDMALGTAPGPITGLNTTMRFTSLFPLETPEQQKLTLKTFNPGFPLENGDVIFTLVPEGVKVDAATWPIGNGAFALDPFTWVYAAEENRVTMRVKDIALGDFLNDIGNRRIEATGNVVGTFPIVVRGIDVLVENGKISVPEGGLIKYDPGPNVPSYTEEEAIKILREKRANEYANLAQDALREFRYRELSASLDGPINGDVEIGLVFDGSNKKVLNRQPFRFDIKVKGELFNIARSFNSNAQVKAEILRQNGKLPTGTIIGE